MSFRIGYSGVACFDACLGWVGCGWLALSGGVTGMGKWSHGVGEGSIVSMVVLVTVTLTDSKTAPRGIGSYTKTKRSILPRKAGLSAQPVIDPVLCNAAIMKQMAPQSSLNSTHPAMKAPSRVLPSRHPSYTAAWPIAAAVCLSLFFRCQAGLHLAHGETDAVQPSRRTRLPSQGGEKTLAAHSSIHPTQVS